jgi:SAM-dependent methyltransferase
VRNGQRYLAEAIESVLSQQDVELELRIYDNGSDDQSVAIAESYTSDPRVTVTENPLGFHYWDSLNRALAETEAPYFAPFACDDVMLPGNLAAKLAALDRTGALFAQSISQVIDGEGVVERLWCDYRGVPALTAPGGFLAHLAPVNPCVLMAVVCRTDALRQVGGFDSRLVYCADWLALLRLAMRGSVATLHEPLVSYRRHAEAGSTSSWTGASFVGELASGLALATADPAFRPEWRAAVPKLFAGCLNHCARELGLSGVHRLDRNVLAAYACAARAAELVPEEPGLREALRRQLAAAGLSETIPFRLVALPPETPAEAERLLRRCASLVGSGLAGQLTIVCAESERARVQALLEEGSASDRPPLELRSDRPLERLLEPGAALVCPASSTEAIAAAEACGVPVLAYDLPSPLETPWDRLIEASLPAPAPPRACSAPGARAPLAPAPRGAQEPSAELLRFTEQFPWERRTILSFVQQAAAALPRGARVLDLGAGEAPYRELFAHTDYYTSDWANSVHPGARAVDFVGSADDLPLPDRCFDAVVNTQMLEHVAEPARVLREVHRVLVPGGRFFLSVPLVWELHEEPYDFYRYTKHGLAHLLEQAGFVELTIEPRNDCFTTIAQLMRNVGAIIGSRPDGLDPQRQNAAAQLHQLADLVASFAPLDSRWLMPLGYAVTAARAGVGSGRGACGLGGARSAIVLAFADEVAEQPELLGAYAEAVADDADVTLALLTQADVDPAETVGPALSASGLADRSADVVALPGGAEPLVLERLAPLSHAFLSRRDPPATLSALPSLRQRSAAELLSAALARSR